MSDRTSSQNLPAETGFGEPVARPTGPQAAAEQLERVLYEMKKVIVGQDNMIERLLVALLARGHVLLEGVPGLAKTLAVSTLAETIGGSFVRLQFTPTCCHRTLLAPASGEPATRSSTSSGAPCSPTSC